MFVVVTERLSEWLCLCNGDAFNHPKLGTNVTNSSKYFF